MLWQWALRRHPNKGKRWVKKKYFKSQGTRNWVFSATEKDEDGTKGERSPAFFKVVVASTVVLSDLYDHFQLPLGVQVHRPDRVPVTCLT